MLVATPGLVLRHWDAEVAVYDGRTAKTHVLADALGEILVALHADSEAVTLDELAARLFGPDALGDVDLDAQEWASMNKLVDELVQLGLVELRHR